MRRIIGTDDMRKKMGEVLDCVNLRGDEFVIKRKNRSLAALVPLRKLEALNQAARNFLLDFTYGQEELSEDEADLISNEAKHLSRKQAKAKKKQKK